MRGEDGHLKDVAQIAIAKILEDHEPGLLLDDDADDVDQLGVLLSAPWGRAQGARSKRGSKRGA